MIVGDQSWDGRSSACSVPQRPTQPARPSLSSMRAVQTTRFGGPEVLDVFDLPDPVPEDGQQVFDVSTAGANYADTHHRMS